MHLFNMVHMCHVDSIVSDSGKFAHSEFYRVLRLYSSNGKLNWSVDEKVSSPFELVFTASF
jgi:hypothetical protein